MFAYPEYDKLMDAWKCEICGKWYPGLGYHIWNAHKIRVRDYNKTFGFNVKQTYLSKDLRQIRREHVKKFDIPRRNFPKGIPHRFKKGEKSPRRYYTRSEQTKKKLRTIKKKSVEEKGKFKRKYIIKPTTQYEEQATI